MQALAHCAGFVHETADVLILDDDMSRGDGLLLVQPPDVQLVDGFDAVDLNFGISTARRGLRLNCTNLFKVMLDVFHVYTTRSTLEKDRAAILDERDRGDEDHKGDPNTSTWIRIETCIIIRQPDDECRDDDANVVDCISNDMNEDTKHAEIMAWTLKLGNIVAMLGVRSRQLVIHLLAPL